MPYLNGSDREVVTLTDDTGTAVLVPLGVPETFMKPETSISIRGDRTKRLTYSIKVNGAVTKGDLSGVVTDNYGNVIAGAEVEIALNDITPFRKKTETNEKGEYSFENLDVGNYYIYFSKDGYHKMDSEVLISKSTQKNNMKLYVEDGKAAIVGVSSLFNSVWDTGQKYIPNSIYEYVDFKFETVGSSDDPIEKYIISVIDENGSKTNSSFESDNNMVEVELKQLKVGQSLRAEIITKNGATDTYDIKLKKLQMSSSNFAEINNSIYSQNVDFVDKGKQAESASIKLSLSDII
jgi:hypothetical protein